MTPRLIRGGHRRDGKSPCPEPRTTPWLGRSTMLLGGSTMVLRRSIMVLGRSTMVTGRSIMVSGRSAMAMEGLVCSRAVQKHITLRGQKLYIIPLIHAPLAPP